MKLRLLPSFSVLGVTALCAIAACDSADPSSTVLDRTTVLPPGPDCKAGGTVVGVGVDRNGNGALDPDEVDHVSTVCNPDLPPTLVRVDSEATSAHCANGGSAVKTGPDRNRSGVLDDDEVTATTYACEPSDVITGDFTDEMWRLPARVAALAKARVITGTLTIAGDAPVSLPRLALVAGGVAIAPGSAAPSVDLPGLTRIGGDLIVRGAATGDVSLPALAHVGGSLVMTGTVVEDLDLPALTSVDGSVQLDTTPALLAVTLPSLTTVGHDLAIQATPSLATVRLGALTTVGETLSIFDAPLVYDVDLPHLTTVSRVSISGTGARTLNLPSSNLLHGLSIHDNPALERVSLPSLSRARDIDIGYAGALHDLDLGALKFIEGAGLRVHFTGLASLDLPVLHSASDLVITSNPAITAIRLPDLASARQLVARNPRLATLTALGLTVVDDLTLGGPLTELSLPPGILVSHDLTIAGTGLTRLPAIELRPGASLTVSGNPTLSDLRGLVLPPALGSLRVSGNRILTSLVGIEAVVRVRGSIHVANNRALTSLTGLDHVELAEWLEIASNPTLTSLTGLGHLIGVGNSIVVTDSAALTSLDGLSALEVVGGALFVARNPQLASIAGLSAVQSIGLSYGPVSGSSISFVDDPMLSPDDIAALLARVRH